MARLNAAWNNFTARGQAWDRFWQDAAAAGGGSITGTASTTQAADSLTASGTLGAAPGITGTLSATQAGDSLTSSGQLALSGSLSAVQAGNTVSASGQLAIGATLSTSQSAESLSASGSLALIGTLSTSQVGDALTAAGTLSALPGGSTLDQILAILTGRKVYDSTTDLWRVYDAGGVELADSSGILLRGLHGWLLQANVQQAANGDWLIRARRRGRR